MKVIAVSMVRDEADIIAATVRHMKTQVDHVIVADNLSVDGTTKILDRLDVEIVPDKEPAYRQSAKMTALAKLASQQGANWIVPFDADEIWYSPFGRLGDVLGELPPLCLLATAQLFDHVATARDLNIQDPVRRIGWRRREPARLPKVACRWRPELTIHQGNHGADYAGYSPEPNRGLIVVRHFPYRSAEQFISKAKNGAAAYKAATELPTDMGAHWRGYGAVLETDGADACASIFRRWFWIHTPEDEPGLVYDPAPSLPE